MRENSITAEYYVELLYKNKKLPTTHLTNIIEPPYAEKYIQYVVNVYLYTLIYADYREYLNLAKIITSQPTSKIDILSKQLPLPSDFDLLKNDIKEFNTLLFKGKYIQLRNSIIKQFNDSKDGGEELWQWAAGILVIGLFQDMMQEKINFNGLIKSIYKNEQFITTKLTSDTLDQIQIISSNNRKRSKRYTRGGKVKGNNNGMVFFLSFISVMVVVYMIFLLLKK